MGLRDKLANIALGKLRPFLIGAAVLVGLLLAMLLLGIFGRF